jgi:hypothetical protein
VGETQVLNLLLVSGGFILTGLLTLVAFFLRRLLSDHDETKRRLTTLETRMNDLKVSIEQNFVSFDTFETLRVEFRKNFENLFVQTADQSKILARLDERSQWEQRLATILDRVAPAKKGR